MSTKKKPGLDTIAIHAGQARIDLLLSNELQGLNFSSFKNEVQR